MDLQRLGWPLMEEEVQVSHGRWGTASMVWHPRV